MTYQISENGLALIAQFEGLVLHPYLDQIGVPTIGYGTTIYPDGRKVSMKDAVITKELAQHFLEHFVDTVCIPHIEKSITVPLNQNQVDALCSFSYNLGAGPIDHSTLHDKINSKAPCSDIQAEFKKWCHAGGKVLGDLVRRRAKEAQLYCS